MFLLGCYCIHKLGFMKMSTLNAQALKQFFIGRSLQCIDTLVKEFLSTHFSSMTNPNVIKQLQLAKDQGAHTVILSASPDFLVSRIAEYLNVDDWAATRYEIDANQIIKGAANLMDGEDKAKFVREMMLKLNISKDNITGYTDSHLDIPFLETVGMPIAVNPDKKLEKLCRHRGWQILN